MKTKNYILHHVNDKFYRITTIIRSKTNDNDLAKFELVKVKDHFLLKKLILSKDKIPGFEVKKKFRNYYLNFKWMSFKDSTFFEIFNDFYEMKEKFNDLG